MSYLFRSFINKKKIFLSKITKARSFKEIILIICIKIIKKSFIKKFYYFKVCLILDALFLDFKNDKNELDNDFSELESINFADFDKQKKLLEKYNAYNSRKKDLLIQEKISHLNHLTSGPSQKWFSSKNIESEITKKQTQIFKKIIGTRMVFKHWSLIYIRLFSNMEKQGLYDLGSGRSNYC